VSEPLYDVARQVTDEVFGEGAYAELNGSNPHPAVQAAIKRSGHQTVPVAPTDPSEVAATDSSQSS